MVTMHAKIALTTVVGMEGEIPMAKPSAVKATRNVRNRVELRPQLKAIWVKLSFSERECETCVPALRGGYHYEILYWNSWLVSVGNYTRRYLWFGGGCGVVPVG